MNCHLECMKDRLKHGPTLGVMLRLNFCPMEKGRILNKVYLTLASYLKSLPLTSLTRTLKDFLIFVLY